MASSDGLNAHYGAIIDGIALLQDLQSNKLRVQHGRIPSALRATGGHALLSADHNQHVLHARPGSRGVAAVAGQHSFSADSAATDTGDGHSSPARNGFNPVLRTKTARPDSRDRVSSAWAARQYGPAGQQLQLNPSSSSRLLGSISSPPVSRPATELARYAAHTRPHSQQVPSSFTPAFKASHSQLSSNTAHKLRQESAERHASAASTHRSAYRQQDHKPAPASQGAEVLSPLACSSAGASVSVFATTLNNYA